MATATETREFYFEHFGETPAPKHLYGLIDPCRKEEFRWNIEEQEPFDRFDWLCAQTASGFVSLNGNAIEIDHHIDGPSEVRSIAQLLAPTEEGAEEWRITSFLTHMDGMLISVHHCHKKDGVVVWEPPIGDPSILPGDYASLHLLYDVAYEGVPVVNARVVAPTVIE